MTIKAGAECVFGQKDFDSEIAGLILKYAEFIAKRGWVCNTLGNIALRVPHYHYPMHGVIYTKHKTISLEEMGLANIVITDVDGGLLYGKRKPSIGHQLNREVFRCRPDINAVIHLHINEVIAYFSVMGIGDMPYISDDTALVLGKPVHILPPNINVEKDASSIKDFIRDTNCFIMPNHGVTTLGRNLSEAFHRMTSFDAEIKRIMLAILLAKSLGKSVNYVSPEDIREMHEWSEEIIYGNKQ